jgi:hypothetical protein
MWEDWEAKIVADMWSTGDPLPCIILAELLRLIVTWAVPKGSLARGIQTRDLIMDLRSFELDG